MAYKLITKYNSPNFTAGREGRKINHITIHWWNDPKLKPSFQGVINTLCNRAAGTSAHYVATGTNREVACLVDLWNTAWADGNWNSNLTAISIECDPRQRVSDYDVIAELIADLWSTYGKLPLKRHRDVSDVATACPGDYDLNKLKKLAEEKFAKKTAKTEKKTAQPVKKTAKKPAQPDAKKLKKWEKPQRFKVNKEPTNLWDLTSAPKFKSVKSYKKGTLIELAGELPFNGSVYYLTEYSIDKKIMNGFNMVDLDAVAKKPKEEKTKKAEKSAAIVAQNPENPELAKISREIAAQGKKIERNNAILQKIRDLVAWIVEKMKSIFK